MTVTPVSYEYEDKVGETVTVDCEIGGLTKAAENVVWTKDGTDVLTLGGGKNCTEDFAIIFMQLQNAKRLC